MRCTAMCLSSLRYFSALKQRFSQSSLKPWCVSENVRLKNYGLRVLAAAAFVGIFFLLFHSR